MIDEGENVPDDSPLLDHLHAQLSGAIELLNLATDNIKQSPLDHQRNLKRIGSALSGITDISFDLYDREPRLIPISLRNTKRFQKYFP
ncbi:MAG: hypothetical protein ABI559_04140 [Chloroflexota bacterium]